MTPTMTDDVPSDAPPDYEYAVTHPSLAGDSTDSSPPSYTVAASLPSYQQSMALDKGKH